MTDNMDNNSISDKSYTSQGTTGDNVTSAQSQAPPAGPQSSEADGTPLRSQRSTKVQGSSVLLDDPKLLEIMHSDIGVITLLSRLKHSITTGKEFASFIKKRATYEEEYCQGLRRLTRTTQDAIKKPEGRQDSFAAQFDETVRIQDQLAEHASKFASSLNKMHDDLHEICRTTEKSRKALKDSGLRNEKNVLDAEAQVEKTKSKYDSLCEEFERVKSGDPARRSVSLKFKANRTGSQYEEELQRKVQAADADYRQKVQTAQALNRDLLDNLRPATVKQLRESIADFDACLALSLQKFASLSETLSLSNGLAVCPMKRQNSNVRSVREAAALVDNDRDFYNYVMKAGSTGGAVLHRSEVQYRQHPVLADANAYSQGGAYQQATSHAPQNYPLTGGSQPITSVPPVARNGRDPNGVMQQMFPSAPANTTAPKQRAEEFYEDGSSYQDSIQPSITGSVNTTGTQEPIGSVPGSSIFGVPLETQMEAERVRLNVETVLAPSFVLKCIEAVDQFGLETEGIYRVNGLVSEINHLRSVFEKSSNPLEIDLVGNPDYFHRDIHVVAGALKQYFRELPDPLLTRELYNDFISAAHIEDNDCRRDALHLLINSLRDANYTTLKYLVFHLYRVQDRYHRNRMSISNLGIVWGPSLLEGNSQGGHWNNRVEDLAYYNVIVETILANCYSIFDPE
ncbi:rho GTPase [Dipodascopsis tothii]|uniref:rho GTPase n=1 Tax=Dipodascopsis tothii TaxID=44089 RepID=UPI0034CDE424